MAAKMPLARIAKAPAKLTELPIGETTHITFTDVIVDEKDLSTYINPDAKLRQKALNTVKIRREEDGYHINVAQPDIDSNH